MPGEVEDCTASGKLLMDGCVKLKQGFAATGYAEDMRFYQDFASRMYFMEEIDATSVGLAPSEPEIK